MKPLSKRPIGEFCLSATACVCTDWWCVGLACLLRAKGTIVSVLFGGRMIRATMDSSGRLMLAMECRKQSIDRDCWPALHSVFGASHRMFFVVFSHVEAVVGSWMRGLSLDDTTSYGNENTGGRALVKMWEYHLTRNS